jgi:hypothetical protein
MDSMRKFCAVILIALTSSCMGPAREPPPSTLHVEEHLLLEAPTLDPLVFKPVRGSMDSVLAAHAVERQQIMAPESFFVDGHFSLRAMLGQDVLVATENYSPGGSTGWVTLQRNDVEIYRIDTGMASPVTALRGLWTYDGHWVLETAYISSETIMGRITRDGLVLNDEMGYSDAFGFQLLDRRPFYFFARHSRIGYSYAGRESMPAFDDIPHYGCCSAAELNPRQALELVAFFARRGDSWYYVEISPGN